MLSAREKSKLVGGFQTHPRDTGSGEVQIAILTQTIDRLATHLKKNRKDSHSRRGLLGMVARRRKLLAYLKRARPARYAALSKKLGLKR